MRVGRGGGVLISNSYTTVVPVLINKSQEIKGSVIHILSNTKGLTGLGAIDMKIISVTILGPDS